MHTPYERLHAALSGTQTTEQVIAAHQATPPRPMPWELAEARVPEPALPANAHRRLAEALGMEGADESADAHARVFAALTGPTPPWPSGPSVTPARDLDERRPPEPLRSPSGQALIESARRAQGGTR
jgi:hypothetical protein